MSAKKCLITSGAGTRACWYSWIPFQLALVSFFPTSFPLLWLSDIGAAPVWDPGGILHHRPRTKLGGSRQNSMITRSQPPALLAAGGGSGVLI